MYRYTNSQLPAILFIIIFNSLQMFIRTIGAKLKLDNLLYQKHVETQVLK